MPEDMEQLSLTLEERKRKLTSEDSFTLEWNLKIPGKAFQNSIEK